MLYSFYMYEMEFGKICAVIPAYNASRTLKSVVDELRRYNPKINIVIIDDGSTDNTKDVAANLNVLVLEHHENLGKGAALKSGFSTALSMGAELIITLDADAQHNPHDIRKLFSKMEAESLDLVVGSRMSNTANMPVHRILSNKITSKLISWRVGQKIEDSQCGLRLIRAKLLKNINLESNRFETESELIMKSALNGFRIGSVAIETIYMRNGASAVKLIADTLRFIKLFVTSLFWSKS
ncbi:MAG: glycosyltransferase family 2 protein [bacterium]